MFRRFPALLALTAVALPAQTALPLRERVTRYLTDLLRIDTSNPPGNETKAANYLKQIADASGIPAELIGPDPNRLSFIARLKGSGANRPLLLIAHSDVVPADRTQWTVDPFSATIKDGFLFGRGAEDVKSLLAAELAVLVELKQRGVKLNRDIILLSESDEEAGSSSMTWIVRNAFSKIDAEFAINEFSYHFDTPSGARVFQIQTAEKIPTRVTLTARGSAGHGSLPREDNAVVHLARALTRLNDADQPVALNATTRRYFTDIAKLPDYQWLKPLIPKLENPATAVAAANKIRKRDTELNAMLRTTVTPSMLEAGVKINVIPNSAQAQVDVRRLPTESKEEVHARLRKIINDPAIELKPAGGQDQPATEPSSLTSPLYKAMEKVFLASSPKAITVPFLMRGTTDGAYLRAKGMAVYGVPIFRREGELRLHGNDERISLTNLHEGTERLLQIVLEVVQ
ncbi:MAG: M20/M25/M40 family metallo-hydrolase [Bryobacteraceae bacterium]